MTRVTRHHAARQASALFPCASENAQAALRISTHLLHALDTPEGDAREPAGASVALGAQKFPTEAQEASMAASWSSRGDVEQAAMGFVEPFPSVGEDGVKRTSKTTKKRKSETPAKAAAKRPRPNPSKEKSQPASPAIAKKLRSQGVPRALKIAASVAQRQATSTARNQAIEPSPAVQNSDTKKRKLAADDAGPRKKKDQRSRKAETSEASMNGGGPDPADSLGSAELARGEHTLENHKELLFFWRERQPGGETEPPLAAHLLGKPRYWPGWTNVHGKFG